MIQMHTVAGDAVLARFDNLVLLCRPGESASADIVDHVLEAMAQVADEGGDGTALADAVAAVASGADVSLVAFAPTAADSLVVTVFGRAWAVVATEHGEQRLAPRRTPPEGLRSMVPGALLAIRAGIGSVDTDAAVQRWSTLERGVVRAGGLVLRVADDLPGDLEPAAEPGFAATPAAAPVPAATPDLVKLQPPAAELPPVEMPDDPTPVPPSRVGLGSAPDGIVEPAVADAPARTGPPQLPSVPVPSVSVDRTEPFSSVVLVGPQATTADVAREALPIATRPAEPEAPDEPLPAHPPEDDNVVVIGVYCKNGHFDDPAARYCAVCGISMAQQTLIPRPGPRPPLGVLVLDDGSIFTLDSDYVVGRDPSRDPDVVAGTARPLRIDDPEGLLSRVHARIHLEGWEVAVVDLGSANGTGVWGPRDSSWMRAPDHAPVVVRPGTQIGVGRRQMRYESHRNT